MLLGPVAIGTPMKDICRAIVLLPINIIFLICTHHSIIAVNGNGVAEIISRAGICGDDLVQLFPFIAVAFKDICRAGV